MSFEKKVKVLTLDDLTIDLVSISALNLHIITDINKLASNWIQVLYSPQNQIYSTKTLLGADDHRLAPVCRYLAEQIVKSKQFNDQTSGADQHICLTFNVSLKNVDTNTVRRIGETIVSE